jgi:chloride channel 3/4/5
MTMLSLLPQFRRTLTLSLKFLFSFTSAHLVNSFAKYAAGSGISEIKCILAGFVMHGYLGLSTFVIKSLTLVRRSLRVFLYGCSNAVNQPLVIASGLSVGKEGPSVHVACAIGNVIARLFPRFSRSEGYSSMSHWSHFRRC